MTLDIVKEQLLFEAGSERKQMKMLEICLKLVGCKSKKGLSSSSSCYLEGKNPLGRCSLQSTGERLNIQFLLLK